MAHLICNKLNSVLYKQSVYLMTLFLFEKIWKRLAQLFFFFNSYMKNFQPNFTKPLAGWPRSLIFPCFWNRNFYLAKFYNNIGQLKLTSQKFVFWYLWRQFTKKCLCLGNNIIINMKYAMTKRILPKNWNDLLNMG